MSSLLAPRVWRSARAVAARSQLIAVTGTAGVSFVATSLAHILGKQKNIRQSTAKTPTQLAWQVAAGATTPTLPAALRLLIGASAPPAADSIIAEYPLTKPGDLDRAAQQLPPHIAVISALHTKHLDIFQEKKLIAHEAASLLVAQTKGKGAAVLSSDDTALAELAAYAKVPITWYGAAATEGLQLIRVTRLSAGGLAAEIAVNGARYELHLPNLRARHHLNYLLAALAAAHAAGAQMQLAIRDSQSYQPPAHMMQRRGGIHGAAIIDDTAEFTPEDTVQALATLGEINGRRRIALLGSIPRLGGQTAHLHQEIGQAAARAVDILITIGDEARLANDAAARSGEQCDLHHLSSVAEAAAWLAPHLKANDVVLVKMDRVQGEAAIERLSPAGK